MGVVVLIACPLDYTLLKLQVSLENQQDALHYSMYAFAHCLVHGLFGLDPGRLVFVPKKGV